MKVLSFRSVAGIISHSSLHSKVNFDLNIFFVKENIFDYSQQFDWNNRLKKKFGMLVN